MKSRKRLDRPKLSFCPRCFGKHGWVRCPICLQMKLDEVWRKYGRKERIDFLNILWLRGRKFNLMTFGDTEIDEEVLIHCGRWRRTLVRCLPEAVRPLVRQHVRRILNESDWKGTDIVMSFIVDEFDMRHFNLRWTEKQLLTAIEDQLINFGVLPKRGKNVGETNESKDLLE